MHNPVTPLPLLVETYLVEEDEPESSRLIDHNSHSDRVWLGNHIFWAFRNGRGVVTKPVTVA